MCSEVRFSDEKINIWVHNQWEGRLESQWLKQWGQKRSPTPYDCSHTRVWLCRLSTSECFIPVIPSQLSPSRRAIPSRSAQITALAVRWRTYFHWSTPSELCLLLRELTFYFTPFAIAISGASTTGSGRRTQGKKNPSCLAKELKEFKNACWTLFLISS